MSSRADGWPAIPYPLESLSEDHSSGRAMVNRYAHYLPLGVALAALGLLAGCGGGGASVSGPTSSLNVSLADAPMSRAGVQSVFITVTGVDVQPTNGSMMSFSL